MNENNIDTELILKLAQVVVDNWDMKTLIQFAREKLTEVYEADKECFDRDCNMHKGDL